MSDGPQGPGWWQATDGRWYPPEQFTGPPELHPAGGQHDPGPTDGPDDHDPEPSARRPGRPIVLLAVAVAVLLGAAAVAVGARWLFDDDESDVTDAPDRSESTSTGPVQLGGDLSLEARVPAGAIAPTSCDQWGEVLRVEVQSPSGAPLSTFAPTVLTERDEERTEELRTLSCEFDFAADVPGAGGYSVAIIDIRAGARPSVTEDVDGADDGGVSVPTIRLTYDCDTAGVCALRRAG